MERSTSFSAQNTNINEDEIEYDKFDVDYTIHIKQLFSLCNQETKTEFNEFNPIMSQDVFRRHELLNITDVFEKIKKTENTRMWQNFIENAFNYKPHQPCCIQ